MWVAGCCVQEGDACLLFSYNVLEEAFLSLVVLGEVCFVEM